MIDLNQVSLALRNSTPRSLILLDEFGKGTLPTDGAGLLCGVIKHALDRKHLCPKVLATTHFHEIFRQDLLDPTSVPISFQHMQVMFTARDTGSIASPSTPITSLSRSEALDRSASVSRGSVDIPFGSGDEITFLYRVAEGLSLDSHAVKCAEIFGIPSRFVRRAQHVSRLLSAHEVGQLLDEAMSDKDVLDLEDAETICRNFLAWNLQDEQDNVKMRLGKVLGKTDNAEMNED